MSRWIALFTAVVAMLGGIAGHQTTEMANDGILLKNEAVLAMANASDQWNYFQAASTKLHLMELAKDLTPGQNHAKYDDKIAKYTRQKDELQAKATNLEKQVKKYDEESNALRQPRQTLALCLTIFQISIGLASVALLARQLWLFGLSGMAALGGLALWGSMLFS